MTAQPRRYILAEANHRQLTERPPLVAVLPWGATEAHNWHLPYGTDVLEATLVAERAAEISQDDGASVVVLPTIPFGNDEQQLDQVCTISFTTATALAVLDDVVRSLKRQGIDRLVILNAHGGNQFKPLVRDMQSKHGVLMVVANFFEMAPAVYESAFEQPGDHADEMETSLMLHLCPDLVQLDQAGPGKRNPFTVAGLNQPGVWTPRPWSHSHPDTGSGDPKLATPEKGQEFFEAVTAAVAELLCGLSAAKRGDVPYV